MKQKLFYFLLATSLTTNSVILVAHAETKSNTHHHVHQISEKALQASKGIFEDQDVQDRTLADWQGQWQSIYPLLLNGDLDIVFKDKATHNTEKNFEEYKAYYNKGYKTDITHISIEEKQITFHTQDTTSACEYVYSGYKILTYSSGKRGVRYLFECPQRTSNAPKFIQFSDHIIEPTQSSHFHIYMGNDSHKKLLQEMENWPTYFPNNLSKQEIVEEMLHH